MRSPRPPSIVCRGRRAGLLLLVLALPACEDAITDPMALVIAEETAPALQLVRDAASIPELGARHGLEERMARATAIWRSSWELGSLEGADLRKQAYSIASPLLADAMGPDGVAEHLAAIARMVESTAILGDGELPRALAEAVSLARRLELQGIQALREGRVTGALALGLEASDVLRAVGPATVAESLVLRAEAAARRIDGRATYGEGNVERARRMTVGARDALDDGAYALAIRRAYYACQLLGVPVR